MAFKLTKSQETEFDKLLVEARSAFTDLESEIEDANVQLDQLRSNLEEKRDAFNQAQEEVKAWIEERTQDWRNEWDEKSEKWQDGDRGQGISSWIDEWENLSFDEIEIEIPEEIQGPDHNLDDVEAMSRDASETV